MRQLQRQQIPHRSLVRLRARNPRMVPKIHMANTFTISMEYKQPTIPRVKHMPTQPYEGVHHSTISTSAIMWPTTGTSTVKFGTYGVTEQPHQCLFLPPARHRCLLVHISHNLQQMRTRNTWKCRNRNMIRLVYYTSRHAWATVMPSHTLCSEWVPASGTSGADGFPVHVTGGTDGVQSTS